MEVSILHHHKTFHQKLQVTPEESKNFANNEKFLTREEKKSFFVYYYMILININIKKKNHEI